MRAVRIYGQGDPEVLRLETVPAPQPGPGDVLVRVRACAVNPIDVWHRKGTPGHAGPITFPRILGADVAGEVAALGPEVAGLEPGLPVVLNPGVTCGRCPACRAGRENECPHYHVLGIGLDGGYAELVRVPAANVLPMPAGLTFEQAAALPLTFLTAWHMLVTQGRLASGETVLVLGGSGGVGTAAIQVARLHGARVIATAGSDHKAWAVKALGADHVINYHDTDMTAEVRRLTERRGVDVVIDTLGEEYWPMAIRVMARGARLITCGYATGHTAQVDLRYLMARELELKGAFMGTTAELHGVLAAAGDGKLRPWVEKILPLEEATEAHRLMEAKQHAGKIVLSIA